MGKSYGVVRTSGMRKTRVLYTENDPALRRVLGEMLSKSHELELVGSFSNTNDTLDRQIVSHADVALIDFALDQNGLNGIELGIALRNINEHIGIVIYSQYSVSKMINRVPKEMRHGWSFFDKSAEMELSDYVEILKLTAAGNGNWVSFADVEKDKSEVQASIFFLLTPRQRSIMSLTVEGVNAKEIAARLNLSYSYVRKELSRSYSILLPEVTPGEDQKTAAVLKYLELLRMA
jgi:DNA-binding NarL/FixJ family response regulator